MAGHSVLAAVIGSNKNNIQKSPSSQSPSRHTDMFPPTDPDDPTDQPWAGRRSAPTSPKVPLPPGGGRQAIPQGSEQLMSRNDIKAALDADKGNTDKEVVKKKMKLWDLIALTISMAGAQVAWTLELGYGTPFLLDLGLSEGTTSLVWLAGPISGLVAQPLIGAISDSSTSKYRRRYWIFTSTLVLIVSTLVLAYARAIAGFLVDLFGSNEGRWDIRWQKQAQNTAIGLAVVCFYLLDFALNALQASLRNLLLDITPAEQLGKANAWHGRMTHAGNILGGSSDRVIGIESDSGADPWLPGFTFGFMNLAGWKILQPLGGDQFRKVCIVSVIIVVSTVWLTCVTQHEKERPVDALNRESSTTWMGEVMAYEQDSDPSPEVATRAGEFALLIYSIVAVVAGTALPYLAAMDERLLRKIDKEIEDEQEEVDAEITKIREMVREWKAEAARQGKPLKLPTMPFMLRNIWTAALVLFGVIMMSTFFISTVTQATVAIALLGICWAVACWVPFAIIMQFLREMDDNAASERKQQAQAGYGSGPSTNHRAVSGPRGGDRPLHARVASTPVLAWRRPRADSNPVAAANERTGLIRRHSMVVMDDALEEDMGHVGTKPVAGGTILGIHNLAIVIPQFLVALIASAIFRLADKAAHTELPGGPSGPTYVYYGKNGVSWVLRFGGLCAFVGAAISRRVPPTKTEKEMRWRLAEMREDSAEGSP
ncbi:hypothetical protein FRB96_000253 [Tulasnella sp. 330]|nr:hypothetical protein FRB96_000253 [Tulasnella sp. 330]KAG8889783.1 hypothetical protein FRB98_002705 [Tulasnella sp. 332]